MEILYSIVIPSVLLSVMVGLGLTLTVADFKRVIAMPKAVVIGLTSQIILLPLLAFVLAFFLAPTPELAVGAIILAACPGGVTSNAYVFAARADLALSVTLTAVASFVTVFTIPLLTSLALRFFSQQGETGESADVGHVSHAGHVHHHSSSYRNDLQYTLAQVFATSGEESAATYNHGRFSLRHSDGRRR